MIKKTNRKSLVEQVVEQMERLIRDGHWQLGEKIPAEMHLMEEFDVSRNTLREAIRALVHAGLLETKQGSGTIVRASNTLGVAVERYVQEVELLDMLDVRLALEKQAAKLAAARRTDAELYQMHALLEAAQKASGAKDIADFIEADIKFHAAIVEASDNPLLIDLYKPIGSAMRQFVQDMIEIEGDLLYDHEHHVALVRAIETGDATEAGQVVEEHLTQMRRYITK